MGNDDITRIRRIHFIALFLVLTYAVYIAHVLANKTFINPVIDAIITYLTSVSFYQVIVDGVCSLVERVPFFMKLYWGEKYVDGFWAYWYTMDDSATNDIHYGIWVIRQNLYYTSVLGFGLSEDFQVRSKVRSVTDFIEMDNGMEVINKRVDNADSSKDVYSRTTMFFELRRQGLLKLPYRMKGNTYFYGGPRNGGVCNNSFIKLTKARTQQEAVELIRSSIIENHTVFGVSEVSGELNETCGFLPEPVSTERQQTESSPLEGNVE